MENFDKISDLESSKLNHINYNTETLVNIIQNTQNTQKNTYLLEYKFVYNLLLKYISIHEPIFNDNFNDGYPLENTYLIKISYNNIPKVINLLKFLHYKNESYLSRDNTPISALSDKSYAFYKKQRDNLQIKHVYCLENDKECNGILLSLHF